MKKIFSICLANITDYRMPQMSGIDLIKKIKDIDYKIKTIIVSAFLKDNLPYDKSYIAMIDKILEKPVYLDRLKNEVQELISPVNIQQQTNANNQNKSIIF